MKAIVTEGAGLPYLSEISEPPPTDGLSPVEIKAAALTNLDILVASGRHYFSTAHSVNVVGREAVAIDDAGRRLFLNALAFPAPNGSMAERSLARLEHGWLVPAGVSDSLAAALGNAGLAGWLPLSWRARLAPGETVLVLGATGVTGAVAVAAARLLGAGRVVAAGRNEAALQTLLAAGADAVVKLAGAMPLTNAFRRAAEGGIDVVVDYLNGPAAEMALEAMATHGRMVQIGSTLSSGMTLNAQAARRASLDVLGFAYYHAPTAVQAAAYADVCAAALAGKVTIPSVVLPLSRFTEAWSAQIAGSRLRYVMVPPEYDGGVRRLEGKT